MKTFKSIVILLLTLCFFAAQAESQDVVKKWNKSFNVNADARFELENKFGDITVKNWNQNTIQIDVVITASDGNYEKMQKLVDEITILSEASADNVKVRTEFKKGTKIQNMELSVDYTIQMPASIHFDVTNAFGNVAMSDFNAPLRVHVEYGSFKAGTLSSDKNHIDLDFSKGEIDRVAGGTVEVEYGGITLDHGQALQIKSSFSEVEIDRVDDLNLTSEYDKISIDFVKTLRIDGEFSSYKIDRLAKRITAKIEYGGLEIDGVAAEFELIKIDSEFGGVDINIDDGSSYLFYARTEFGSIDLPGNAEIIDQKKDINFKEFTGRVGQKHGDRKVEIEAEFASITIK